jgi:hypothetical protein
MGSVASSALILRPPEICHHAAQMRISPPPIVLRESPPGAPTPGGLSLNAGPDCLQIYPRIAGFTVQKSIARGELRRSRLGK